MRYPAVRKCCCLYTMYHINNSVFSCGLKVVRLQSDIRNAVGKLEHMETLATRNACLSMAVATASSESQFVGIF